MFRALARSIQISTLTGRGLAGVLAVGAVLSGAVPDVAGSRVLDRLTTSTGKHLAVPAPEVRGIPNFAQIESGLARGGQPTDEGIEYLRDRGFRTVIGFRTNAAERLKLHRAGITYVEIPLRANLFGSRAPTEEQVRLFLSTVGDSTRRPVFFHCRRGADRTGAMAAIYRIEACGWTPEEAIEEMRTFGFNGYYKSLLRFVRRYVRRVSAAAIHEQPYCAGTAEGIDSRPHGGEF